MMAETNGAFVVLTLALAFGVRRTEPLMQESLSKLFGSFAAIKYVRTPELLNQLCNESQGTTILRDACYGCFYRASTQPTRFPMLLSLSACADDYLQGTDYGHCATYLNNATRVVSNNRVSATTIYCTFLECVRQVNKDTLLRVCVGEAIRMFPSFNRTDVQLAQLFVNTTACVLAKTRCAYMNPITGEFQEEDIVTKLQSPSINAILVNSDYDINIVQLPNRHGSLDVCAKFRSFEQASWPSVTC